MSAASNELLRVLRSARECLARPANNFYWSGWQDADAAIREIDGLIGIVETGTLPRREDVSILFLPTGPIQEVSISSGWGDEFLSLAEQADDALERAYAQRWIRWLKRMFGIARD